MRILFVLRHSGYVRNFEWLVRELARRGHAVHLAFETKRDDVHLPETLAAELDGVTWGYAPVRSDPWQALAGRLRPSLDYLRYLDPVYRDAGFLRERATRGVPGVLVRLAGGPGERPRRTAAIARALRAWSRAIPVSEPLADHLRAAGADALVVTPLVSEPNQHELVRAARSIGLPVALAVHSWDNLTNKGVLQESPDRTYVWNEIQRDEAVRLHGLAPADVAAVGAHSYDHWFTWQPGTEREAFCATVGLDPSRPYLLYVGSSAQIAPDEATFVRRWLGELRADPALAEVGVLVRPHPYNGRIWEGEPLAGFANVVVWPPLGAEPRDPARRSEYFDSIHHSTAVVGLNTSALIEAAIVGRRTYTIVLPDERDSQGGTLHFRYLVSENGGPLVVATSFPEHLAHLRSALDGGAEGWRTGFLESFVRPHGLEDAGATRLADDLERFVAEGSRHEARSGSPVLTALSRPLAWLAELLAYGRPGAAPPVLADGERRPQRPLLRRLRREARKRRKRAFRRAGRIGRR